MNTDLFQMWVSLRWLCRDLGIALIDCPADVRTHYTGGRPFEAVMAEVGVQLVSTDDGGPIPEGLSIYGHSVYLHGERLGQPAGIAARNAKGATRADLVASIESARWALKFASNRRPA